MSSDTQNRSRCFTHKENKPDHSKGPQALQGCQRCIKSPGSMTRVSQVHKESGLSWLKRKKRAPIRAHQGREMGWRGEVSCREWKQMCVCGSESRSVMENRVNTRASSKPAGLPVTAVKTKSVYLWLIIRLSPWLLSGAITKTRSGAFVVG